MKSWREASFQFFQGIYTKRNEWWGTKTPMSKITNQRGHFECEISNLSNNFVENTILGQIRAYTIFFSFHTIFYRNTLGCIHWYLNTERHESMLVRWPLYHRHHQSIIKLDFYKIVTWFNIQNWLQSWVENSTSYRSNLGTAHTGESITIQIIQME